MPLLSPEQLSEKLIGIESTLVKINERLSQPSPLLQLPASQSQPATQSQPQPATVQATGGQSSSEPVQQPPADHAHGEACPGCKNFAQDAAQRVAENLAHAAEWAGVPDAADRVSDAYQKWAAAGFPEGKQDVLDSLGVGAGAAGDA